MVNELIDEILQVHTLDDIMLEYEISEYEVLQALLDTGLLLPNDLKALLTYDEYDDDSD